MGQDKSIGLSHKEKRMEKKVKDIEDIMNAKFKSQKKSIRQKHIRKCLKR